MLTSNKYRRQEAVYEALSLIKKNGGEMRSGDVFRILSGTFPKSEIERAQTKSGNIRWENWLAFYSIDAVKAGLLIKSNGIWHITEEGEKAITLSIDEFAKALKDGYNNWYNDRTKKSGDNSNTDIDEKLEIDVIQAQAANGIRDYILNKNPYEFQDLVAALLRAMGYYTPFISPKGKDGGIDVIAYRDPLGTSFPRLKVQVKHYPNSPISVDIVRSLMGVLSKEGEVGIVVTSGNFTGEAKSLARNSHIPVRLIDIDEFITLWLQYYSNMDEVDKLLLPIIPVYFVKPTEK